MILDHSREKLFNAIIYFATNTHKCGKVKLFKLLYFFDFMHFSETGRSVTGLTYYAWKMGPVPADLSPELIPQGSTELSKHLSIEKIPTGYDKEMVKFVPKHEFNEGVFSKRELCILKSLAEEYQNSAAQEMIEATHLENQPWHRIWEVEGRKQQEIPYLLALKSQEAEEMEKTINENKNAWAEFFDQ